MYELKQIPEDFIVEEINTNLQLDSGDFSVYKLTKKNYNTADAIKRIADYLKTNPKYVNYAGTKDKVAITHQYITISKGPEKNIELKDIKLEFLGTRKERLALGDLDGNKFTITIRNIHSLPKKIDFFPNYFDKQRFGQEFNNHIIGKYIILGEFEKAKKELKIVEGLVEYIQKLPKKISLLYIHAYQSYLYNKIVNEIIKKSECETIETEIGELSFPKNKIENEKIPLIGFGTEESNMVEKILDEENITTRDFIVRKIPHLSSEGGSRDLIVKVKDLQIGKFETDELNENKKKCVIIFKLGSGSYATMAIRAMMLNNI